MHCIFKALMQGALRVDLNRTSERSSHKELYKSCKELLERTLIFSQGSVEEDSTQISPSLRSKCARTSQTRPFTREFPMRMCQAKTGTTPGPTLCARCKYIPHVLNRLVKKAADSKRGAKTSPKIKGPDNPTCYQLL